MIIFTKFCFFFRSLVYELLDSKSIDKNISCSKLKGYV